MTRFTEQPPHVSHALFTPRWDHWHANAGTWKWAEEGPGEAMDIRLSKACLPVWLHFQKHYPQEAKEMLKAREEAGVKPTEGIPMTGWTGGYIGTGGSNLHKDKKAVVGLTTVIPVGVGWVERSVFVVREIAQGFWLEAGDIVYVDAHSLVHGSTKPNVQDGGARYVISLFCQKCVLNVLEAKY